MGGNGSRSHFLAKTLDNYLGVRFDQVGTIDGNKVIVVSNQTRTAIPTESFESDMYYVTKPGEPNVVTAITFYDKNHNLKLSIDIEYSSDGSFKPYRLYTRKGKVRSEGSHMHRWFMDENGNKVRKSHDPSNTLPINRHYMHFVNKALKYNKDNGKQ